MFRHKHKEKPMPKPPAAQKVEYRTMSKREWKVQSGDESFTLTDGGGYFDYKPGILTLYWSGGSGSFISMKREEWRELLPYLVAWVDGKLPE